MSVLKERRVDLLRRRVIGKAYLSKYHEANLRAQLLKQGIPVHTLSSEVFTEM
jgi:hypothetical protein